MDHTYKAPLLIGQPQQPQTIEVCRSFSRKPDLQNYGGKQYEAADFFASRKMVCDYADRAYISQELYEECVLEVQESMAAYIREMKRKREAISRPEEAA